MAKRFYLIGAILGTVLPYFYFVQFLLAYGLDIPLFVAQLLGTPVSAFFGMDVIVSSLVLWLFVFVEGRRLGMKHLWLYVAANLTVGVSLALPLFLYFREDALAQQ